MQPARRVDYHYVRSARLGGADGVEHHGAGVGAFAVLDYLAVRALCPDGELLGGGGAEGVRRGQEDLLALGGVFRGQLAYRGRLAHAVHTHHEYDGGLGLQLQLEAAHAQVLGQDVHQRALDLVRAAQGVGAHALAQLLHRLHGGVRSGVGQYQRVLQLLKELLVLAGELGEQSAHLAAGLFKPLLYLVEESHCLPPLSALQLRPDPALSPWRRPSPASSRRRACRPPPSCRACG